MKTLASILILCLIVAGREITSPAPPPQFEVYRPAETDAEYPDLSLPPVSSQF